MTSADIGLSGDMTVDCQLCHCRDSDWSVDQRRGDTRRQRSVRHSGVQV